MRARKSSVDHTSILMTELSVPLISPTCKHNALGPDLIPEVVAGWIASIDVRTPLGVVGGDDEDGEAVAMVLGAGVSESEAVKMETSRE